MNVMPGYPVPLWEDFLRAILVEMHRVSLRGFAVNFFVSLPPDVPADQLYCSDPDPWVRYCESELGCSVEVVGDYGLREFILLVRRERTSGPRAGRMGAVISGAMVT